MKHQPMSHHLAVGDRVDLPQWSSFRTLYPIFECMELLAFVGVETGWGKPWRVYKLMLIDKEQHQPAGVTQLDGCAPLQRGALVLTLPRGQSGKEAASIAALQHLSLVDMRKEFHTKSELIEQQAKQRGANQRLAADRLASAIKQHASKLEQLDTVRGICERWKASGHVLISLKDRTALEAIAREIDIEAYERAVERARELAKTFEGKQS